MKLNNSMKKWIFIVSSIAVIICAVLKFFFPKEIGNIFYVVLALSGVLIFFSYFYPHLKK
jgi:uncharacterized membrane protein